MRFSCPFFMRLAVCLIMVVVLGLAGGAGFMPADAASKKKIRAARLVPNTKYAAIVIEVATGEVLKADNADKQLHPASLTKMMTLLLTFDALAEGRLRLTDYIRISNHAASMPPSKVGLESGQRMRVDEAIRAISVKSANDIAAAMAEALAGDEDRFAQKMTARARGIGMTRTQFVNASGLHNRFQLSTARDMATLSRYIIQTYPKYYRYFGLRNFAYGGKTHPTHNKLMTRYSGMDGMKTGYISQSGFNLVASAHRGGRRLIGVVFGGRTGRSRDDHMEKILDAAFEKPAKQIKPKVDIARFPDLPPSSQATFADSWDTAPVPPQGAAPSLSPSPSLSPGSLGVLSSSDARGSRALFPASKPVLTSPKGVTVMQMPPQKRGQQYASSSVAVGGRAYTVQIGAYQSRDATDRALYTATKKLPRDLIHATPIVAPLKSVESGWLFRARLGNLSRNEADRLCRLFESCLVLSPEKF